MAGGKGRKQPTHRAQVVALAAPSGKGFLWPWLWIFGIAVAVLVGPLVVFLVYCYFRSQWCFKRRVGLQDGEVPHSAPIELYWCHVAQESQKVHCCLQEKGVAFEAHDLDGGFFGRHEHLRADVLLMNPNGTLPFLVHHGRPVLGTCYEIMDYIDRVLEGPGLVPRDSDRLAELEAMLQTAVEFVSPAVRALFKPTGVVFGQALSFCGTLRALWRHPNPASEFGRLAASITGLSSTVSPELAAAAFARLNGALDVFEKRFADGREYLVGAFSVADIALMAEFGRLDQLGILEPVLGEERNALRAYWERLKKRESFEPSFRRAVGAGPEELRSMLARFREDMGKRGPVAVYGLDGAGGEDADEDEEES